MFLRKFMLKEDAHKLYAENWNRDFTTMEDLYQRIKNLAENGCYQLCVYIDSESEYDKVMSVLHTNGFNVEHYQG